MPVRQKIADWLEIHWVLPSFSGWLLIGLAVFFFAAATNTLAGWLYVMSGVLFALLAIAMVLPSRSLRGIRVKRYPIQPVSAGDDIRVELAIENLTPQSKSLVQVQDLLPPHLAASQPIAIERIPALETYHWVYQQPTQQRGVYRWQDLLLRTAAPLGLFWCRRSFPVKAIAVVYPTVLSLTRCPLVDELGQNTHAQLQREYRTQGATEGVTRTLRPYRWGDPTRLIHWRTSARYGELRIRELEIFTGGQEVVICLDTRGRWQPDDFEQAVIAAASLYSHAVHHGLEVVLWTATTGVLRGEPSVLEALAAIQPGQPVQPELPPDQPLVGLTSNPAYVGELPLGSRWVLWGAAETALGGQVNRQCPGIVMQPDQSLPMQLQSTPTMR